MFYRLALVANSRSALRQVPVTRQSPEASQIKHRLRQPLTGQTEIVAAKGRAHAAQSLPRSQSSGLEVAAILQRSDTMHTMHSVHSLHQHKSTALSTAGSLGAASACSAYAAHEHNLGTMHARLCG